MMNSFDPRSAHHVSLEEIIAALSTEATRGLDSNEARLRLERHGRNELAAEEPKPIWRKFLAQFVDPLVILLLIATLLSTAAWVYERDSPFPYEATAILCVVLLNAMLGFTQERQAEAAVAALRAMSAAQAKVVRDGRRRTIPAAELVPGDLISLEEGDSVPADARLTTIASLQAAEAALTGESLPTSKSVEAVAAEALLGDRRDMVFSGTTIVYGHGSAIVTATGMNTEMGRIAGMLKAAPEEATPLQRELARLGKSLGAIVVLIAVVMIFTIVIVEDVHGFSGLLDVLLLGVALAVAAVPEGLPAIVTGVLSLGVRRMAGRKAIVRHLVAVETLGSADVIATDKTGTLTKNEMTVRVVATASGRIEFAGTGYEPNGDVSVSDSGEWTDGLRYELERTLTAADRANNAVLQNKDGRWVVQGDPTEGALIVAARKAGLDGSTLDERFERLHEVPFSSERKLMTAVCSDADSNDRIRVFSKGAADVLLARCSHERVGREIRPLDDERRRAILAVNEALAGEALRTLGIAGRSLTGEARSRIDADGGLERDLVFLGIVGMIDPPRDEARRAVEQATLAGIRPIMITGDHPSTAAAIAAELGIAVGGRVVTGVELKKFSDDELEATVGEVSVYARVEPEHKLRIVTALQNQGATVAMTGDGVNDAPALKKADIGVAMGTTGTDVSKEAADLVLTDDNFATIVAAVAEGRAIFDNIRKFLRYLLSSNVGEVMTMFFGVLLSKRIGLYDDTTVALPLAATQILWINLITDGAPALALGIDPAEPDVMRRRPRSRREGIITPVMWRGIVFVAAIMATGTLLVVDASLPGGLIPGTGDLRYAQTMAFTTLTLFQLFNVFNARSDTRSAFSGLFSNSSLWGAVVLSLVLHCAAIYVPILQQAFSTMPLRASDWLVCTGVASSVVWLRELSKLLPSRGEQRPK